MLSHARAPRQEFGMTIPKLEQRVRNMKLRKRKKGQEIYTYTPTYTHAYAYTYTYTLIIYIYIYIYIYVELREKPSVGESGRLQRLGSYGGSPLSGKSSERQFCIVVL